LKIIHDITRPEAIKKALVTTSALYGVSKVAGYLKNFAIAAFLGFSYQTDAFFFAVGIIGIFSIFSSAFDSVGVPYLVKARQKGQEIFNKVTGQLLGIDIFVAVIVSLLTLAAIPLLVRAGWGFSPDTRQMFSRMMWILFPTVGLSFLYHHFAAVLRAQRLFTVQTIAELITSIVQFTVTAGGLFFYRDPFVLAWAMLLAMVCSVCWQLPFVRGHLRVTLRRDEHTRTLVSQFLLFTALYAVSSVYGMIDKAFASYLETKSISALVYGSLIAMVPIGIIRLDAMFFTAISEKTSRIVVFKFVLASLAICLPYGFLMFLFPAFFVKLILGYGHFGVIDTALTAQALRYYALALPALYMNGIFSRVLIIKEYFSGMFALLGLNIILNIVMNYIFMFNLRLGLRGLVIATVLVAYIDLGLRVWLVGRKKNV
jgi:putative peptidoglycan lipid II flippase